MSSLWARDHKVVVLGDGHSIVVSRDNCLVAVLQPRGAILGSELCDVSLSCVMEHAKAFWDGILDVDAKHMPRSRLILYLAYAERDGVTIPGIRLETTERALYAETLQRVRMLRSPVDGTD